MFQMFFKPRASALDRFERSRTRRNQARQDKLKAKREASAQMRALRAAVWGRDGGKCRACSTLVQLRSDDPFKLMHAHHIRFRSAGGEDTLDNLVSVCGNCHDLIHRHLIVILGNPNETVTFTEFEKSGEAKREWESPC